MTIDISSRCGHDCKSCFQHRLNVEKDDKRAEVCITYGKLGPKKYTPEEILCDGCLSEKKKNCKLRKCVEGRGLEHCGFCSDYLCTIFPAEPDADAFYKEMEQKGIVWTEEDDKYMEPFNPKKNIDEWRKSQE